MAATTLILLTKTLWEKGFFYKACKSTETFTEHVVNAIRSGNMQNFRTAYRSSDILIIDDIQVLGKSKKTSTKLLKNR